MALLLSNNKVSWASRGAVVKNLPAKAGGAGSIPGSGRPPGEGNGNPVQYSCLEIPWTEELGGLAQEVKKELDRT